MMRDLLTVDLLTCFHFSLESFSENSIDESSAANEGWIIPEVSYIISDNMFHSLDHVLSLSGFSKVSALHHIVSL